jgi:hypothetical protein
MAALLTGITLVSTGIALIATCVAIAAANSARANAKKVRAARPPRRREAMTPVTTAAGSAPVAVPAQSVAS